MCMFICSMYIHHTQALSLGEALAVGQERARAFCKHLETHLRMDSSPRPALVPGRRACSYALIICACYKTYVFVCAYVRACVRACLCVCVGVCVCVWVGGCVINTFTRKHSRLQRQDLSQERGSTPRLRGESLRDLFFRATSGVFNRFYNTRHQSTKAPYIESPKARTAAAEQGSPLTHGCTKTHGSTSMTNRGIVAAALGTCHEHEEERPAPLASQDAHPEACSAAFGPSDDSRGGGAGKEAGGEQRGRGHERKAARHAHLRISALQRHKKQECSQQAVEVVCVCVCVCARARAYIYMYMYVSVHVTGFHGSIACTRADESHVRYDEASTTSQERRKASGST